jgi:hypothetical protein
VYAGSGRSPPVAPPEAKQRAEEAAEEKKAAEMIRCRPVHHTAELVPLLSHLLRLPTAAWAAADGAPVDASREALVRNLSCHLQLLCRLLYGEDALPKGGVWHTRSGGTCYTADATDLVPASAPARGQTQPPPRS